MIGSVHLTLAAAAMSLLAFSCAQEPELSPFERSERRYNYLKNNNGSIEALCKQARAAEAAALDELSDTASSRSLRKISDIDRVIWSKRKLKHCDFKGR